MTKKEPLMKKYKLTEEEKDTVERFCRHSIPYVFKSGEYFGYLQFFELVDFEVCYDLLSGKNIDEKIYQTIAFEESHSAIKKRKLDEKALEYYNLYLQIRNIVKKYHRNMPIPKHLKPFATCEMGTEKELSLKLICICHLCSMRVAVCRMHSKANMTTNEQVKPCSAKGLPYRQHTVVKAFCTNCGKEIIIFDNFLHGYIAVTEPKAAMETWEMPTKENFIFTEGTGTVSVRLRASKFYETFKEKANNAKGNASEAFGSIAVFLETDGKKKEVFSEETDSG